LPAGFAAWNGLNGDSVTTQALAETSAPTGDATISARTSTTTTGGFYGYAALGDGKAYIQNSGTSPNGVNQMAMALITTGRQDIVVGYTVDILSANPRTIGVVAQYRVGSSGPWVTLTPTAGNNPFSRAGGSPGLATTVSATLPAAANNKSVVQIRWAVWRGTEDGNSSGLALDNITVSSSPAPIDSVSPAMVSVSPTDNSTNVFPTTDLMITFNEDIAIGSGSVELKKTSDNSVVPSAILPVTGATVIIKPTSQLNYNTSYYVEYPAGAFKDLSDNPAPAVSGAAAWNFTTSASPSVVISQYYEGVAGTDRYIELKNLTGSTLSLDGYRLAVWSDTSPSDNEGWKSGAGTTDRVTSLTGYQIPPNGSFLVAATNAGTPGYAGSVNDLVASGISAITFDGDDSVVLYSGPGFTRAEIVDAFSISANQATDKTFYRLNNLAAYDFNAGSSVLNYTGTWASDKSLADVASAGLNDPWYLRASFIPETLTLVVAPASFSEGGGAQAATATVTRTGPLGTLLNVNISISDATEATADGTVDIPANQASASFFIAAVNDPFLDGDKPVTVTVSAAGFLPGVKSITVLDEPADSIVPVVINEVDSDQTSSDTLEFIELYNKSGSAQPLDGLVLVLYDGDANLSYRTVSLAGLTIPANGYFVIGNPAVTNAGLTFPNGSLQNGADAVALYIASPAEIPNGTSVGASTGTLVDAVVYGTSDPNATVLIAALTPGKPQVDEGAGPASETVSISRLPNGGAAFDSSLYVAQAPSPGTTNILPPPNTYSNWIDSYFNGVTNPLIIGFGADPDGDGVRNGVEALTGGNPNAAGVFAITELTKTGNTFTFRYPQDNAPPSGVTASYEWSTDMVNWQATGVSFGGATVILAHAIWDDTALDVDIYQVTATVTVGTASKLFVRVAAKN
jgi:hypothetical protein